jgi:hypothetical protein
VLARSDRILWLVSVVVTMKRSPVFAGTDERILGAGGGRVIVRRLTPLLKGRANQVFALRRIDFLSTNNPLA